MNKKLIALAVAAAASTGATAAEIAKNDNASLEMGGRVEARLSLKDKKVEDKSRVRLNFLGKTQITDELYGLGFYEGEFKAYNEGGDNDFVEHRYAFAGIGGNFGEVTFGTVRGSLQAVTDFTDIMAYHGGTAAPKVNAADRPDRSIAYAGTFGDFEARANYTLSSATTPNSDESSWVNDNNGGYALSGIYSIGDTGARLTAAYASQDENDGDTKVDNKEFMLGASYEFDAFYVAGLYTNTKAKPATGDSTKGNGYELAGAYTMGQAKFTTTYNRLDAKEGNGDKQVAADNVAVDATYFFNDNFRSYVSYNFNLLKGSDGHSKLERQNEAVLGLRYDF
ncbi:porin [Vibrio sp. S9_S30]|uniref:porin n=1 Tax=Vibrio sp. S9_S30 TaxID=2720226 RepID=UPI00168113D3|nr:porin [Vibrio sp. S9_S30]MBD1555597.1 porin [Vibrio sp. S9_S30]